MTISFDDNKSDQRVADLRQKEEEDLAQLLAERYGLQYVDLSGITINTDALKLVSEETAQKAKLAIFDMVGKKIKIALLSPKKEETLAVLSELDQRGYSASQYIVSNRSLMKAWSRYADISFATESKGGALEINSEQISEFISKTRNIEDTKKLIDEVMVMKRAFRVSRIVEIVVAGAIATKASDIHVEPEEEYARLRFRIDGVLVEIAVVDSETFNLLLSRLKILSGMKLNIKDQAQDGRFSIKINDKEIEIRSSILPGAYSESVVMRLLNPDQIAVDLKELGIEPELQEIFNTQLARPDGLVLNTGPTGSGKTTTLYAFLKQTLTPGIKIITIEDPIEYHLKGIVQTQVEHDKGYDFANGLRSALRQDPDIIMVGEIRDIETAETAIHAALTGHLVFSTLHTNTAAGAFTRLIDLGVNPKVLTSAIRIAIAQRLVRRLCPDCKKQIQLEPKKLELAKAIHAGIDNPKVEWNENAFFGPGDGCSTCNGLKYKGRVALFEAVLSDKAVEDILQMNPSEREIKVAARAQGILDMSQDGICKALKGITDIGELERVINLEAQTPRATLPDKENNFTSLTNEDLLNKSII
ncbi:MAG: type pilus assembly ATPase PilB, type pilus assembly protein PilB [Candidatus Parcubacteria bacterium]|jgi:type IV pilus assembly protein PilB